MTNTKCAIWGTPATHIDGYEGRDGFAFDSPRAGGRYFITGSAMAILGEINENQKIALTHEVVENNILDSTAFISTETLSSLPNNPKFSPISRANRLLIYLIRRSEYLGQTIVFEPEPVTSKDPNIFYLGYITGPAAAPLFAWSDSAREKEVWFLLNMLAEQKFVQPPTGSAINEITVLPAGYAKYEQDYTTNKSDQAFVAMWFNDSMQIPYESGVEAAVRECGYRPLRIDRKEHNNRIDDEIIAEIRKSKFIVADFTSEIGKPRGGVYFEAGSALGIGLPVIWTCRSDILSDIHFDTRQFNHIVWNEPAELKEKLKNRIMATIGSGPLD